MTRLITITSGKGGVGKTNLSINLALYLAARGLRTCLFDADLGLANINILLGIYPQVTLRDVLFGGKKIEEVIIPYQDGVHILPGSSGVAEMIDLDHKQVEHLIRSFLTLEEYDFFLFDTSAGIAKDVLAFCLSSPEVLVVITPEPTSLTDAYALVKILTLNGYHGKIRIAVNLCKNASHAKAAYGKFKAAVKKFLGVELTSLGMIYEDEMVPRAVAQQKPVSILYPKTYASQCIKKLADRLAAETEDTLEPKGMKAFWEQCVSVLKSPPIVGGKLKIGPETDATNEKPDQTDEERSKPAGLPEPIKEPEQKMDSSPSDGNGGRPELPPSIPAAVVAPNAIPVEPVRPERDLPEPARTVADKRLEAALPVIVEKLTGTLTVVAEELVRLRQSVEKIGTVSQRESANGFQSVADKKPKPVALDFEAYVKRRHMEGKDV